MAIKGGKEGGAERPADKREADPPATQRGMMGSEKAAQLIGYMDQRLESVRRAFQAYFLGFDKLPPMDLYHAVQREFREFQQQQYAVAAARWKAQNLIARWNLHRTTWERDLVRMEEGSFHSHAHAAAMRLRKPKIEIEDV
jgi:hypothetical protein